MSADRLNVIHVLSDQHNAKVLGHYDHPEVKTPKPIPVGITGECYTPAEQFWDRYRYVFYPRRMFAGEYPDGFCELYDLEADPWNVTNLALDGSHDALLNEMRARLPCWMWPNRPGGDGSRDTGTLSTAT